jgi:arabinose-5-phosphate isomerase
MLEPATQVTLTAKTSVAVPQTHAQEHAKSRARAFLASAKRTLLKERQGLDTMLVALDDGLGQSFVAAVEVLRKATGRVILSGVGKSGHIARKIAATLASTGTPAFFVHAAEASHGDLGMITRDDVVVALSWSGETAEFRSILLYAKRFRVPLIAVTAGASSTLAKAADVALILPKVEEACPHGLAPTTSTLIQMALGDALAIALLEARGFTADDFLQFHPGGSLGANLARVRDVMHSGDRLPLAPLGTRMRDALLLISQKGFGCLGVTDAKGDLVGIITDGDLRRHLSGDILDQPVETVMTSDPKTIGPDALVASALDVLNAAEITALLVVERRKPVGIVHMHDLLRIGVA